MSGNTVLLNLFPEECVWILLSTTPTAATPIVILERQREGIAIAKRKGIYKGRKPVSISPEEWQAAYSDYCTRKINKVRMANRLGISRTTLDKLLKKV